MLLRVVVAVEPPVAERVEKLLAQRDVLIGRSSTTAELQSQIARGGTDLFLVSRSLVPGPIEDLIRSIRESPESSEIVLLTDREDPEERAELLASGCLAVLSTSLAPKLLGEALDAILGRRRDTNAASHPIAAPGDSPRLGDFVSHSSSMQAFMDLVYRVVGSDTSLLVLGETGVGKEHLARAIHAESPRADGPFVTVNCGALPETLLESELFGHERGAFTGATRSRRGLFEAAHRGTVFLDEIGELPHHLQVKLLHVLQRREIQRLGGEHPFQVDVRIMAATNRDLEEEVREKRFRMDLYYRMSVVTLAIPPLKERQDDIADLAERYLSFYRDHLNRDVTEIAPEALQAMCAYEWPGNIRELINIVERAVLLCRDHRIELNDLPEGFRKTQRLSPAIPTSRSAESPFPDEWLDRPWKDVRSAAMDDLERRYLSALLELTGGRIGDTAKRAGIDTRSVYDKMRRLGLRKEDFKPHREEHSE